MKNKYMTKAVQNLLPEEYICHQCGIVKLFCVYGSEGTEAVWRDPGIIGVGALLTQNSTYSTYIRIYACETPISQILFECQLSEQSHYQLVDPLFHCFETERNLFGLLFVSNKHSKRFHSHVTRAISMMSKHAVYEGQTPSRDDSSNFQERKQRHRHSGGLFGLFTRSTSSSTINQANLPSTSSKSSLQSTPNLNVEAAASSSVASTPAFPQDSSNGSNHPFITKKGPLPPPPPPPPPIPPSISSSPPIPTAQEKKSHPPPPPPSSSLPKPVSTIPPPLPPTSSSKHSPPSPPPPPSSSSSSISTMATASSRPTTVLPEKHPPMTSVPPPHPTSQQQSSIQTPSTKEGDGSYRKAAPTNLLQEIHSFNKNTLHHVGRESSSEKSSEYPDDDNNNRNVVSKTERADHIIKERMKVFLESSSSGSTSGEEEFSE